MKLKKLTCLISNLENKIVVINNTHREQKFVMFSSAKFFCHIVIIHLYNPLNTVQELNCLTWHSKELIDRMTSFICSTWGGYSKLIKLRILLISNLKCRAILIIKCYYKNHVIFLTMIVWCTLKVKFLLPLFVPRF